MRTTATLAVITLGLFTILATGGGGGDGTGTSGSTPSYPANVVVVDANITSPTTWETGKVYLITKWDFYVENTLTIEPGVVIKFHPSDGPYMMLGTGGTVMAQGTASDPIIFTSFKDDSHGGDTNGDGTATSPGPGDWGSVNTNGEQGSVFEYCHFYYGGNGSYKYTLELYDSRATVRNCVFAHNTGGKVGDFYYGALDAGSARVGTDIQNNRFYDNIIPLSIGKNYDIDDSNIFQDEAGTVFNDYNAIYYNTVDDFDRNVTWQETEVPYVIDDNDLWIETGNVLTLGNNVVLKFVSSDSELLLEGGTSCLVTGTGVAFTSYKDDSRKGDTNHDGSATTAAHGDWDGIYDDSTSAYLNWSNIYYDNH